MDPAKKFKKYLSYSVILHIVVFIVFLVLAEHAPVRKPPETKITMVRLAPRLGLPTGAPEAPPGIPEPPKEAEKETPPPEVKAPKPEVKIPTKVEKPKEPPPKPKAKPKKPKPKSVVRVPKKKPPKVKTRPVEAPDDREISKALTGIDQELQERERQIKEAQTAGTPGTPSTGPAGLGSPQGKVTARDPSYARYQGMVRSKIIRNWVRTHAGDTTQKLRARIRVRINASGAVISKVFSKRSGDAAFDNSAMRAVEKASPFPPPPPSVKAEALTEGFVVDFRARVVGQS